jgi:hypothetical protein
MTMVVISKPIWEDRFSELADYPQNPQALQCSLPSQELSWVIGLRDKGVQAADKERRRI